MSHIKYCWAEILTCLPSNRQTGGWADRQPLSSTYPTFARVRHTDCLFNIFHSQDKIYYMDFSTRYYLTQENSLCDFSFGNRVFWTDHAPQLSNKLSLYSKGAKTHRACVI